MCIWLLSEESDEIVSDEPQVSSTPGATVGQPEMSEGSVERKELASIDSVDPVLVTDSDVNVDLADWVHKLWI